jgi:hypothetical protein
MCSVSATGLAIGSRRRLAFPVDQLATDCEVSIASRGRELAASLVESKNKNIALLGSHKADALTPRWHGHFRSVAKRSLYLYSCVSGVSGERQRGLVRKRDTDVLDPEK